MKISNIIIIFYSNFIKLILIKYYLQIYFITNIYYNNYINKNNNKILPTMIKFQI